MQMQMTDIDWRLPIAEKLEEKEAQKQLQNELHKKFESLVVASRVMQAVEKFKGLLKHVRASQSSTHTLPVLYCGSAGAAA